MPLEISSVSAGVATGASSAGAPPKSALEADFQVIQTQLQLLEAMTAQDAFVPQVMTQPMSNAIGALRTAAAGLSQPRASAPTMGARMTPPILKGSTTGVVGVTGSGSTLAPSDQRARGFTRKDLDVTDRKLVDGAGIAEADTSAARAMLQQALLNMCATGADMCATGNGSFWNMFQLGVAACRQALRAVRQYVPSTADTQEADSELAAQHRLLRNAKHMAAVPGVHYVTGVKTRGAFLDDDDDDDDAAA